MAVGIGHYAQIASKGVKESGTKFKKACFLRLSSYCIYFFAGSESKTQMADRPQGQLRRRRNSSLNHLPILLSSDQRVAKVWRLSAPTVIAYSAHNADSLVALESVRSVLQRQTTPTPGAERAA